MKQMIAIEILSRKQSLTMCHKTSLHIVFHHCSVQIIWWSQIPLFFLLGVNLPKKSSNIEQNSSDIAALITNITMPKIAMWWAAHAWTGSNDKTILQVQVQAFSGESWSKLMLVKPPWGDGHDLIAKAYMHTDTDAGVLRVYVYVTILEDGSDWERHLNNSK